MVRRRLGRIGPAALVLIVLASCAAEPATESTSSSVTATTGPSLETSTTETTSTVVPTTPSTVYDPPPPLFVLGDWGTGTMPEGAVAGAMATAAEQEAPEAILTTGDNFYSNDADFIMDPYQWAVDAGIEFWITWGNHDVQSPGRIEAVNVTFDSPPRWGAHEWGDIHIVILDSNQLESGEQVDFLVDALGSSDRPTVVVFHHPPLTCGKYRPGTDIGAWSPHFDDDVVLVMSGHDHNYQRFESDGITYVVTGGGGAETYPIEACPSGVPSPVAGEALHHFVELRQTEGAVTAEVIDVNGSVIDEFEIPTG